MSSYLVFKLTQKGFSFAELLLSLVMTSFIGIISFPAYFIPEQPPLILAATRIESILNFAQQKAITDNTEVIVKQSENQWTVYQSGKIISLFERKSSVLNIDSSANQYYFTPYGYINSNEFLDFIDICDQANNGKRISISASGRTNIMSLEQC